MLGHSRPAFLSLPPPASTLLRELCLFFFSPCSFQISAVFPHRVNSDPLLLSLICEVIKVVEYLQDEQNPKIFPSLPASSTLCKWFCSEEAACFGSFSVFLACWASKILILKVVILKHCLCAAGSVARYGVILPGCLKVEDVDMVWWGVIYSCPPSGGRYQGQSKPWDSKALFTAECRQVTQKPECFLCKTLKISFCCRQLGVFRANNQQTECFLHCFPVANIRGLQLSWDRCFCQDTCQPLLCTRMKMY